jgi:glyoxylase I family protein
MTQPTTGECARAGRHTMETNETTNRSHTTQPSSERGARERHAFVEGVHGVRYQVMDVGRSVKFYTEHLGFTLEHEHLPAFATVALGETKLLLSGPDASGSRPMPDGQRQTPGGWNRLVLRVKDLRAFVDVLKAGGQMFRNDIESGPGGSQIQIEDPDGNPVELFESAH